MVVSFNSDVSAQLPLLDIFGDDDLRFGGISLPVGLTCSTTSLCNSLLRFFKRPLTQDYGGNSAHYSERGEHRGP